MKRRITLPLKINEINQNLTTKMLVAMWVLNLYQTHLSRIICENFPGDTEIGNGESLATFPIPHPVA